MSSKEPKYTRQRLCLDLHRLWSVRTIAGARGERCPHCGAADHGTRHSPRLLDAAGQGNGRRHTDEGLQWFLHFFWPCAGTRQYRGVKPEHLNSYPRYADGVWLFSQTFIWISWKKSFTVNQRIPSPCDTVHYKPYGNKSKCCRATCVTELLFINHSVEKKNQN